MCSLGGGDVPFWGVEMCQIWGVEMCLDEVNYSHKFGGGGGCRRRERDIVEESGGSRGGEGDEGRGQEQLVVGA